MSHLCIVSQFGLWQLLLDVPCHLDFLDIKAALLVKGHVVLCTVKDHLLAAIDLCNRFEKLNYALSKVFASRTLVHNDVLDVPA